MLLGGAPMGAEALALINTGREEADRVLLCVDSVHGFGIDDVILGSWAATFLWWVVTNGSSGRAGPVSSPARLGRGRRSSTIPSLIDSPTWQAWSIGIDPEGSRNAGRMTPGGYKAFEHLWYLPQTFAFQEGIGKERVAGRTHALAAQLKEGLSAMRTS
jgi:hypothetical protein